MVDRQGDGRSECGGSAESVRSTAIDDWRTIRCEIESLGAFGTIPGLDGGGIGHGYP